MSGDDVVKDLYLRKPIDIVPSSPVAAGTPTPRGCLKTGDQLTPFAGLF